MEELSVSTISKKGLWGGGEKENKANGVPENSKNAWQRGRIG